jgi:hypothetical protein
MALAFGGIGYGIYAVALLVSLHEDDAGFSIFAGALLGVCAGLLWTAQGTIMLSYPPEELKGRYWTWFWGIFNVGACIGALVLLANNAHTTTDSNVSDGTYISLIVLMFLGAVLALFLVNANDVIRSDGSKVVLMKNPTWRSEFVGLYTTVKYEPYVILLFPMFWSSNWFYTYQQNAVNGAYFDTRTRALNSFLYWFAQIIAASAVGPLLDFPRVRRVIRARFALGGLVVLTLVVYGGGYAWQKGYDRASVATTSGFQTWDWSTSGYAGPMFLYFFYGFYDAAWQGCIYW